MKKSTTFTASAGKALKSSGKVFCQVTEQGEIFVTSGQLIFRMSAEEYRAAIQPAMCLEAGNWSVAVSGKELRPTHDSLDMVKAYADLKKPFGSSRVPDLMERCPMEFSIRAGLAVIPFYNPDSGLVTFYNKALLSAFPASAYLHAVKADGAALVEGEDRRELGMIFPIRGSESLIRTVKAYYGKSEEQDGERSEELNAALDKIAEQEREIEDLKSQLKSFYESYDAKIAEIEDLYLRNAELSRQVEQLQQQTTEKAQEETAAPEGRTAAEIIASRFEALDGVQATIKGAKTSAPVVWLSGETDKHADELRAMGAQWSGKRGAFYARVA